MQQPTMNTKQSDANGNADHGASCNPGSQPEAAKTAFRLDLKSKKKPKKPKVTTTSSTEETKTFFEEGSGPSDETLQRESVREFDGQVESTALKAKDNLVIPVQTTGRVFGRPSQASKTDTSTTFDAGSQNVNVKSEDAEAIEALLLQNDQADAASNNNSNASQVIASAKDTFQRNNRNEEEREAEQFQNDLRDLPDAMDLAEYGKCRVPIGGFGAAMLRGMGWTGNDDNEKQNDKEPALPRPHRLGLGATPKVDTNNNGDSGGRKRPRTMDQYERDKKLQKQAQDFARQRQQQVEADKQQSLQNGSLVMLKDGKTRARLIQTSGVPGLNQVKVQVEGQAETTIIKRGDVGHLLTRRELEETPFVDRSSSASPSNNNRRGEEDRSLNRRRQQGGRHTDPNRSKDKDRKSSSGRSDRKSDKSRSSRGSSNHQKSRDEKRRELSPATPKTWVIPQIKVRIVTEKLGRRYFKEKGVVVDVTSKGSTVELADRVVLDRVPERYIETALPKAGGRVVVLTRDKGREYLHCKGTLLERGKGRGVVQLDSDKSVLELSLDDLAEWMGPVEDE